MNDQELSNLVVVVIKKSEINAARTCGSPVLMMVRLGSRTTTAAAAAVETKRTPKASNDGAPKASSPTTEKTRRALGGEKG